MALDLTLFPKERMAGEHILIVDDSEEITSFLIAVLQPLGYEISCTGNGKEGLAKALFEKPDLVLLDLNLPGMTGISILEALHQRKVRIPVIMMTFHSSGSVVARALRLGARDYITKPFQVNDILRAIERVLAEERERRAEISRQVEVASTAPAVASEEQPGDPAVFAAWLHALMEATSREAVLERATEALWQLSGASSSAIFLPGSAGALSMVVVRQTETCRLDVRLHDKHAETAVRTQQPLLVEGQADEENFATQLGLPVRDVLYLPLLFRDRVIGVLGVAYLQEDAALVSDVQNWLFALSDYIAILLENARLQAALRHRFLSKRVLNVLQMLANTMARPLQALWKLMDVIGTQIQDVRLADLCKQQVRTLTVILAVLRDLINSNHPLYIGKATAADVESAIKSRLRD